MVGQNGAFGNGHGDHRPTVPAPGGQADGTAERLEALRSALHNAIDQLEAMARRRLAEARQPVTDAAVERRLRDLETARGRFRAEVERWEGLRREQVEALEQDRLELAAVWQKIEDEQTTTAVPSRPVRVPRLAHPGIPGSSLPPTTRPKTSSASESPLKQDVLEQFQALRRDVRRNAEGRQSHR
jgi:hypothetical protein